mgnify:CR=1 FL=1
MNSKHHETYFVKDISPTQKVAVHLISFNNKSPVLAIQHMWKENESQKEWQFGKMSVMTEEIILEMIKENILQKALEKIEKLNAISK